MANPIRGEVEVQDRDGKVYMISLRNREICDLEVALETEDVERVLFGSKEANIQPLKGERKWRKVVRVAFGRHHADLVQTEGATSDLIDIFDKVELSEGLYCAWNGWTREKYRQQLEEYRAELEKAKGESKAEEKPSPPVEAAASETGASGTT
jgi:hypothetical protein